MRQAPQTGSSEAPQPEPEAAAPPPAITDVALVKAYLDGDAGAFDTLFSRYHSRVRAVAMRYVGDEHTAEDLVQETM